MYIFESDSGEVHLLSLSIGKSVITDILGGELVHELNIDHERYLFPAYSDDLTKYALMTNEGEISVFKIDQETEVASSSSQFPFPRIVMFSPEGEEIAILFGEKRELVIWDYHADKFTPITSCGGNMCTFSWIGDSSEIIIIDYTTGFTRIISALDNQEIQTIDGIISAGSGDGRFFAGLQSEQGPLTIWNRNDGTIHTQIEGMSEYPNSFGYDSRYLLIPKQNHGFLVWDVELSEVIREFDDYELTIDAFLASNEPTVFFRSDWDTIIAFDIDSNETIREFNVPSLCDYRFTDTLFLMQTCRRSTVLIVYGVQE